MKSLLIACLLSLAACASSLAADKNEKPLSVTFTHGPNGAPRDGIFIAGETVFMKVVAKDVAIPKTGKCLLPTRHYIVDKDDQIAYSHSNDNASARVSIGYANAKLLLECPVNTMLEPGEYFFVTEIRNRETGQIYRNRKSLTIIPWNEFAISQFCFTTARASNVPIGPSFEVGQPALLHFVVQSPQANKDENYRLESRLRILNEAGKNVEQVREETISELPATSRGAYPMWTEINISTPGTYVAEVEVKDLVSGKAITKSIPFRVFDSLASIRHLSQPLDTANDAKQLSATFTRGMNGPARGDNRFLAGEMVYMTVSAKGYPIPKGGLCRFSAKYSVLNDEGKTLFTTADDKLKAQMEVGADLMKLLLRCELTTMLKSGDYEFVTELRDQKTREVYYNRQSITILPQDTFALCQFCFAGDREGTAPLGATFETCQQFFLTWVIYNPQAQDDKWQVATSIRVLDSKGRPTAPPRDPQKQATPVAAVNVINSQVAIAIENPGEYSVEVSVQDLVSEKTATRSIPFRVVPSLVDTLPAPAQ